MGEGFPWLVVLGGLVGGVFFGIVGAILGAGLVAAKVGKDRYET